MPAFDPDAHLKEEKKKLFFVPFEDIISITVDSNGARYASVFLMAAGIYPSVPSILCILPNNTAGITKRSAATAMQLMVRPFSFPSSARLPFQKDMIPKTRADER